MKYCLPLLSLTAFLLLHCVSSAEQARGATVDPSGTWRWEDPEGISAETNVLRLNLTKKGRVVGRFNGYGNKRVAIKNGRLEGNQLSFEIDLDIDGAKIHSKATGTIDGDEMTIVAEYRGDEGPGTSTVKAKRSVGLMDVVGQWKLKFETPDGYLLQPTLVVAREKRKQLKATYTTQDDESFPVKDVQLKDNSLSLKIQAVHQGAPAAVTLKGRPYGPKMNGILTYDYEGQVGDISFEAQKVRTKKRKKPQ